MCVDCVLALQAAAQDLDGGGLVVSGAQVAQARRGRRRRGELRARRRLGVASRQRGAVYGRGCRAAVSRGGRDTVSETDAWARGKIK